MLEIVKKNGSHQEGSWGPLLAFFAFKEATMVKWQMVFLSGCGK